MNLVAILLVLTGSKIIEDVRKDEVIRSSDPIIRYLSHLFGTLCRPCP